MQAHGAIKCHFMLCTLYHLSPSLLLSCMLFISSKHSTCSWLKWLSILCSSTTLRTIFMSLALFSDLSGVFFHNVTFNSGYFPSIHVSSLDHRLSQYDRTSDCKQRCAIVKCSVRLYRETSQSRQYNLHSRVVQWGTGVAVIWSHGFNHRALSGFF